MTKIPMLNLARMHEPMRRDLTSTFEAVLDSARYINGPSVLRFEKDLAEHVGVKHVVAVSSGTDALLVSMMALDVKPGDEIITTPYTFFATAGCIARLGARPVFVDIDPASFNIDVTAIESVITDRTVGIVPVHLFGQCADMAVINEIAQKRGLWVLEDAAQAIGAKQDGVMAGNMGLVGTYSFFPAKNLGTLGDGGAVVTNDDALAEKIRAMRGHGAKRKYYHDFVGGNFRLDALHAAMLSIKLPYLNSWEDGRRRVASAYEDAFINYPKIATPVADGKNLHVYNQYVIRASDRDELKERLTQAGIGCAVYYPMSLHVQPCFEYLGYKEGAFPESELASRETLAIPVDPLLTEEEQGMVIQSVLGDVS